MKRDEFKIVVGLHRNCNYIDRKTSRLAADHGLTFSQFMVLEALHSKGDMSVGEVRDIILSSIATIPLIINNLVKRNYVKRLTSEKDKRLSILHLTEEGREVIEEVLPKNEELILEWMNLLTEDEKEELVYLLKKLGEN